MGCWGSYQDPDVCDYDYKTMPEWGRAMFVTPGVVVDGELVTNNLVDINLNIRILLGHSYYDDWNQSETFVKTDPLGNPVDQRHPWNQTTIPRPQKRDFDGKYSWVMCPRWLDQRTGDHLALDTGGGPIARLWATALAGLVNIGYVQATGQSVKIYLPKTALKPEMELEWKIPKWSNALERDRARTYFQAYSAAAALYFVEKALAELQAGRTRTFTEFKVPDEAIGCGFHEAVRGVLSHHLVIRERQDRQLSPLPADALERDPARPLRHARALRGRGPGHADLRGERAGQVQGHRHHARGAQLRSLPAVRRPHVPRQRQDARDQALADVRRRQGRPFVSGTRPDAREQEALARVQELIAALEGPPEPAAAAPARELVQLVLDLHANGLARMLEIIADAGNGRVLLERLRSTSGSRGCCCCTGCIRKTWRPGCTRPWPSCARTSR